MAVGSAEFVMAKCLALVAWRLSTSLSLRHARLGCGRKVFLQASEVEKACETPEDQIQPDQSSR